MRRRRNLGIHFRIFCEEELCFIEFALIISAVGRAFLRPREDWRRVGERFPRGVTLTDDCWTPRMLHSSHVADLSPARASAQDFKLFRGRKTLELRR